MQLLREYPKKIYLGENHQGEKIYMTRPSWDCNWYWGFGYIGHRYLHIHLNRLGNSNMFNNIKTYFQSFILSDKEIWTFCEIVQTIYSLRHIAEVFNGGGSHYTNNPCKELLTKPEWYNHINKVLIPQLIDEMYKVLKV